MTNMPDITEIISLLDELRGKATQGEWQQYPDGDIHMEDRCGIASRDGWEWAQRPKNYVAISWDEKGAMNLNDAAYIVALHNNYEALRQAALDGERYKKKAETGEALAKKIETFKVIPIVCGSKEAQYSMNFLLAQIERQLKRFGTVYRQAVEQKEV